MRTFWTACLVSAPGATLLALQVPLSSAPGDRCGGVGVKVPTASV
jgi:hypothetical protein